MVVFVVKVFRSSSDAALNVLRYCSTAATFQILLQQGRDGLTPQCP